MESPLSISFLPFSLGSKQKTREEKLEMDDNVAYGTPKEVVALRTKRAQAT